jgi:hypothetical protein
VDTKPWIISLENSEKSSPAHVSSKLDSSLTPSSISINLSSDPLDIGDQERTLTISGSISPAYPNESVAVYFSQDRISYNACRTETDNWGNYSFSWNLTSTGTYYIRTSWSGNLDCAGADSEILTVFVGFPASLIQFEGPGYNYIYGRLGAAAYEVRIRRGIEEFLSIDLSGTGVLLTGEFIILRSGQTISSGQTQTITIPLGAQPLRLPDDLDQTTNNQFGFILKNNGGNNYSISIRGMDYNDISQIKQLEGNGTVFMNASTCIRENTWYKVVARMSEDEIIAELHDINGTLLELVAIRDNAIDISEFALLVANNTDSAVAFKNLNVETLNHPTQLPEGNENAVDERDLLAPYVTFTILLATIFAAVIYVKKRKKV